MSRSIVKFYLTFFYIFCILYFNILLYMTLTYNIKCIPVLSKTLYTIKIKNYKDSLAKVNFIICNRNTTINNLEVNEIYQRQGYGSLILNNLEKYVKYKYDVNYINLLAWQELGSTNIVDFFKKNGYIENKQDEISTYDDYSKIYDLYPFYKKI